MLTKVCTRPRSSVPISWISILRTLLCLVTFQCWWHFSFDKILVLLTLQFWWNFKPAKPKSGDIRGVGRFGGCTPCLGQEQTCLRPYQTSFCNVLDLTVTMVQWWANTIKWTRTNIQIYLDATLCTEQISEYIWMPVIYRKNIQIYSYSGNNTNTNNI